MFKFQIFFMLRKFQAYAWLTCQVGAFGDRLISSNVPALMYTGQELAYWAEAENGKVLQDLFDYLASLRKVQ